MPPRPALPLVLAALAVAAPNAHAGVPYVTDDGEVTETGHVEIDVAGQVTRRKGETSGVLPSLDLEYGALPGVQLHLFAPLAFDRVGNGRARWGAGDLEAGVKLQLLAQDTNGWRPSVALFPAIDVPTGSQRRGLGTGRTHVFLPLWISKDIGPWTAFGGGGYWINPGPGNLGWGFYGGGVAFKASETLSVGAEVFHATPAQDGRRPTTGFNLGAKYDLSETYHLLLSVGRGVQNPLPTNQGSAYLGLQVTF